MNFDPLMETALPVVLFLLVAFWLILKELFWNIPHHIAEWWDLRKY